MVRDSERLVVGDIKEQTRLANSEISRTDGVITKQKFVQSSLTEKQADIIKRLSNRANELDRERTKLR